MHIRRGSWAVPKVFTWLQQLGAIADDEMYRVFNMGIGLVVVVAEFYAEAIARRIRRKLRIPAWVIGEIGVGERNVIWE